MEWFCPGINTGCYSGNNLPATDDIQRLPPFDAEAAHWQERADRNRSNKLLQGILGNSNCLVLPFGDYCLDCIPAH